MFLFQSDFSDEHKEEKSVQVEPTFTVEPLAVPAENKSRSIVPDWLTQESFVDILRKNVPDFKSIKTFSVSPATAAGDNYLSVILKVDINIELEGELDIQNKKTSKSQYIIF